MNTALDPHVSKIKLVMLRAMYFLILVGLAFSIWPDVIKGTEVFNGIAPPESVVFAMLTSYSIMAYFGLWHPLKMLPLLMIELLWKSIWLITYGLSTIINTSQTDYSESVMQGCVFGVVLTLIVMPWRYVYCRYLFGHIKN